MKVVKSNNLMKSNSKEYLKTSFLNTTNKCSKTLSLQKISSGTLQDESLILKTELFNFKDNKITKNIFMSGSHLILQIIIYIFSEITFI